MTNLLPTLLLAAYFIAACSHIAKAAPVDATRGDAAALASLAQLQTLPLGFTQAPVGTSSAMFTTSTKLKAAFASTVPKRGRGAGTVAVLTRSTFTTKQPAVNIGNLQPLISKIACTKDQINVTFRSASNAKTAEQAWRAGNIIAMLPREAKCEGIDAVELRRITSAAVKQGAPNELVLRATQISRDDAIDTYDIAVDQFELPSTTNESPARITETLSGMASSPTHPAWASKSDLMVTTDVNFDRAAGSAKNKDIVIFKSPRINDIRGAILCANCYVAAKNAFNLRISGKGSEVRTYSYGVNGEVVLNHEIKIGIDMENTYEAGSIGTLVIILAYFSTRAGTRC